MYCLWKHPHMSAQGPKLLYARYYLVLLCHIASPGANQVMYSADETYYFSRKMLDDKMLPHLKRVYKGTANSPKIAKRFCRINKIWVYCIDLYTHIVIYIWHIIHKHRPHTSYIARRHGLSASCTLEWRHYERECVSNYRLLVCLFNRLRTCRSKEILKFHFNGLYVGNSSTASGF